MRLGTALGAVLNPRLAILAVLLVAAPALALPGSETPVSIVAREQPLAGFLRDLFAQAGQTVIIEGQPGGTVSGSFAGTAGSVFRDIGRAFGLIASFDGSAIHVFPASAVTTRTFRVAPRQGRAVISEARDLGLSDTDNRLRLTGRGLLVASGTPRFVAQIGELAGPGGVVGTVPALATGGRGQEFRVFTLRFARAEDTTVFAAGRETRVPGLASLVRALVTDAPLPTPAAGTASFGARRVRQSANRLGGGGLASLPPELAQLPVLGFDAGAEPAAPASPPAAAPVVGGPRIEASPHMNAVIVRDVPERMASYERLIRALDVEPQMVEVEVTIVDVNIRKLRQLGINFRIGSGGFGALFGNGTASDLRLLPTPGTVRDNVDNITPRGAGGTISAIIGSQREFIARVNALEQRGAARIVSRPQVMTLSNVEAVFDRSRTFFVRVQGSLNVDLFNVTAGTVLRVNPHVFEEQGRGRMRLLVSVEDGNLVPDASVDNIPQIERSSVATQALITDGESLLLGGLTVDAQTEDLTKVPVLGDIPLLGELFRSRSRSKERSERLFLITPRLASPAARAARAAAAAASADLASAPATKPGATGASEVFQ